MENLDFAVKYPFTSQGKQALEQSNISISSSIIDKALRRIKGALKGSSPKSSALHPSEMVENIASYAAARMILSTLEIIT